MASKRVPLPNSNWVRSTKMPKWAICLDPSARHYGWKMAEYDGRWVSGGELSLGEIEWALNEPTLAEHHHLFQALLDSKETPDVK